MASQQDSYQALIVGGRTIEAVSFSGGERTTERTTRRSSAASSGVPRLGQRDRGDITLVFDLTDLPDDTYVFLDSQVDEPGSVNHTRTDSKGRIGSFAPDVFKGFVISVTPAETDLNSGDPLTCELVFAPNVNKG